MGGGTTSGMWKHLAQTPPVSSQSTFLTRNVLVRAVLSTPLPPFGRIALFSHGMGWYVAHRPFLLTHHFILFPHHLPHNHAKGLQHFESGDSSPRLCAAACCGDPTCAYVGAPLFSCGFCLHLREPSAVVNLRYFLIHADMCKSLVTAYGGVAYAHGFPTKGFGSTAAWMLKESAGPAT